MNRQGMTLCHFGLNGTQNAKLSQVITTAESRRAVR